MSHNEAIQGRLTREFGYFYELVTTWGGKVYLAAIFLMAIPYIAIYVLSYNPQPNSTSVVFSMVYIIAFVFTLLAAWQFDRSNLVWVTSRSIVVAFGLMILLVSISLMSGSEDPLVFWQQNTIYVLLLSFVGAMIMVALTLVVAFVLIYIVKGTTGWGKTPEERILGHENE